MNVAMFEGPQCGVFAIPIEDNSLTQQIVVQVLQAAGFTADEAVQHFQQGMASFQNKKWQSNDRTITITMIPLV